MSSKLVGAGIVAALLTALAYRPVRSHLRAASLLYHLVDPEFRAPLLPSPSEVREADLTLPGPRGPVEARFYIPVGVERPPGLILLHGIHKLGMHDPRVIGLARSLAGAGAAVLTPEITSLTEYQVDASGIDVIGASASALAARGDVQPGGVALLGTSFAGGLALLAAADGRFAPSIRVVLAVGAHDDLARVSRFLATGMAETVDGPAVALTAHEYGALVLAHSHPEDFFTQADVPEARAALRLWLREERPAALASAKRLTPAGQERFERLLHDRASLRPELLACISRHQAEMALASPHGRLAALQRPVFLLHGADDPVIPPTEEAWLARDVPAQRLGAALVTPLLDHVSLRGTAALGERWKAVHLLAGFLELW